MPTEEDSFPETDNEFNEILSYAEEEPLSSPAIITGKPLLSFKL